MKLKRTELDKNATTSVLMPISIDVDLVRFEKNLLQIGFFGANDARDKNRTSRRVEQVVFRNGHRIKVAAEFRGSELLGLPSTTDRDKFIALLKIMSEDRARTGSITNPIRFSGYRLIQELGLSRNGEIYEEILRWGKRMTDTTITSEQVVYRAAKKVYSDEVLHVFRSFRRTGTSNLNGSEKQEHYEVVLEDWLVENLNQRYVVPEDFNAYKQLARPTAKGIFGNLHLWFHASQGRQVEKDYAELCNLLNIQTYPHLSKIKSTMGLALNELVNIRYISSWDVQPMSTKHGYKILLQAGEELLRILDKSRPERRQPQDPTLDNEILPSIAPREKEAFNILIKHGLLPSKAVQIIKKYGSDKVRSTVDYLETHTLNKKRNPISNPAGLIIHTIESSMSLFPQTAEDQPYQPVNSADEQADEKKLQKMDVESAYLRWKEKLEDQKLKEVYPGPMLDKRVKQIVDERSRTDKLFRRVSTLNRKALALQIINKEIRDDLVLPSFEDWCSNHP